MLANHPQFPAANIKALRAEAARLNRKAAKLGCTPLTLTVGPARRELVKRVFEVEGAFGRTETVTRSVLASVCDVQLDGEIPSIDGWTVAGRALLGVRDGADVAVVLGAVPAEARVAVHAGGIRCDHCGTTRSRKRAFIVTKGAEVKVVGATCLRDFTGGAFHGSPAALLTMLDHLRRIMRMVEDAEEVPTVARAMLFDVRHHLAVAVDLVKAHGRYVPRETAQYVREVVKHHQVSGAAFTEADEIIRWAAGLENPTGYLASLKEALGADLLPWNLHRLVCSATVARREVPGSERAEGPHIGAPGERANLGTFQVVRVFSYESQFGGGWGHVFRREGDGAEAIWFTSRKHTERGDLVNLTATVKSHDFDRDGRRVTKVNRCKLEVL